MGSTGKTTTAPVNRPLSETWQDNIPESATKAQRDTLNRLFRYGSTAYDYLKLEYTEFDVRAIENPINSIDPDYYRFTNSRRQPETLQVSFTLQRKDREENPYLNSLDRAMGSVMIGPRGGLFTYDGYGRREMLSVHDATSRISIEERLERDVKQYKRRDSGRR